MVKNNKIIIFVNYSVKFMGFKMVDGRQYIVIKLLFINKQNLYLLGLQLDVVKDSIVNLQFQILDIIGFLIGIIIELSDIVYMKVIFLFLCLFFVFSGKVILEREMVLFF